MTRILAMAAALALPFTMVRATPDEVMNDMFEVYTNTTDPRVLDSQRRGGVTLGRVSARVPVTAPRLISYTPPAINGGCGGIDLYGGSFSFINKDQMTEALRSIATNAVSYAFTLSLQSVCPPCMQTMQSLRDQVDEINAMMRDSCHWATTLVDGGLAAIQDSEMAEAQVNTANENVSPDVAGAAIDSTTLLAAHRALASGVVEYNIVWKVMKDGGLELWFGTSGDDALLEVIMSITGSLVRTENAVGTGTPCTDDRGQDEYCYSDIPSLLSVDTFIDGGANVRVYSCGTPAGDCLNPTPATVATWRGFSARVRDVMFGPGGTGGLLDKLRDGTTALTAQETAFLANAPGPINDILNAAILQPGSAATIGAELQGTIASILARQLVMELIYAVRDSFGLETIPMKAELQESLVAREREFATRNATVQTDLAMIAHTFNLSEYVTRAMALQQGLAPVE